MSCSWIGIVMSSRVGIAFTVPLNSAFSISSHCGTLLPSSASSALAMRATSCERSRSAHRVARAQQHRRDRGLAAVHPEVAVAHELARLGARGREAEPEHDVVEPALEQRSAGSRRCAPSCAWRAPWSGRTASPAGRTCASPSASRAAGRRSPRSARAPGRAVPAGSRAARRRTWRRSSDRPSGRA